MSQRHFHIWVKGRSLCDVHDEKDGSRALDGEDVATCGPCIIAADWIRGLMYRLLEQFGMPDQEPLDAAETFASAGWWKGEVDSPQAYREAIKEMGWVYPTP